jgi:hypothetical protein
MTLSERIKAIQAEAGETRRLYARETAKAAASRASVRVPFFLVSQTSPKSMAEALCRDTIRNIPFLSDYYASAPAHFADVVVRRARLVEDIENCGTVEEARKLLVERY